MSHSQLAHHHRQQEAEVSTGRPIACLLVEEKTDPGRGLMHALQAAGYGVDHVARLDHAMRRVSSAHYDLVVLDLTLPDSTGISTLQRLHLHAPELPIVVILEGAAEPGPVDALAQGAQGFLMRGDTDPRLLAHTLRTAVARQVATGTARERDDRFAVAFRGTGDGLWDWNVRTGTLFLSARWSGMLGYPEEDTLGDCDLWFDRVYPEDRQALRQLLEAHEEGDSRHFEHEHRMLTAEGDTLWVLTRGRAAYDLEGALYRVAGSMTDITDRKRVEEQLRHNALHDPLTGLTNRVLLADRINLALVGPKRRTSSHFAVFFLDLDRFKRVNDNHGHSVGDRLLVEIGERLRHFLRPGDTVARLGGDEFAILLTEVADVSHATHVAERVQSLLAKEFLIDGHALRVTASVGIALSTTGYETAEEILHDADIAMYRAKSAGPGRYQVFEKDLHDSAVALIRLETELRGAVERREFVMHYQPIVSLDSGRIAGFEGLVRWNHPQRGLVAPAQFLAVAEETGLIVPLGWWVLAESCRQIREWQDRFPAWPPLYLSANVSGKLLMQTDMVDRLLQLLDETGLAADSLRLELTENLVFEHGDAAVSRLLELRASGLRFSVDDFGTGYSSLSHLQRFRYDALKIDRSFVSGISSGTGSSAVVETILALAGTLGIGVIAEGVETEDQAELLRRLHCPHGQGFWFAKPLAPAAAEQLIASSPSWWGSPSESQ